MAHLKAFRQRWLAAAQGGLDAQQPVLAAGAEQKKNFTAALQQPTAEAPAKPAAHQQDTEPLQQRQGSGGALLPRKRLLESCGTGPTQQQSSTQPAKKQRQAEVRATAARGAAANGSNSGSPAPPRQQQPPKPKSDLNGRLSCGDKSRRNEKSSGQPAPAAAARVLAAPAAAKAVKQEGGVDTGKRQQAAPKEKPAVKQGTSDGMHKKEAAAAADRQRKEEQPADKPSKKEAAAAPPERPLKKEPSERPAKKEAAAAAGKPSTTLPAEKLAKGRVPADANSKAKAAAAPKQRSQAAKPTAAAPAVAVKQEQQEHAESNPSSLQREGATGAAAAEQQAQQHATSSARPAVKLEAAGAEAGSNNMGTPVEVLLAPAEAAEHVGEVVVAMYCGHSELWEAVRSRFAERLQNSKARLLYQDSDGDWLLLQPEAPWHVFTKTVRKLVISCLQQQQPVKS